MSKLQIRTKANSVVIVGDFCKWELATAKQIDRIKGAKFIVCDEISQGEYKVLDCKSYQGNEIYPTNGRFMSNRYFDGTSDETINVFFKEGR